GCRRMLEIEVGKQLLDRRIEGDCPFVRIDRGRHAGESLGGRTDRKTCLDIDRRRRGAVPKAKSGAESRLSLLDDGNGDAGIRNRLVLGNSVLDDLHEIRSQVGSMDFHVCLHRRIQSQSYVISYVSWFTPLRI